MKNTFKKYFNYKLQNTFKRSIQLLLSITLDKWPKMKNKKGLAKVIKIQNTFRSHCESISQSINEYSFNKQHKHKQISRFGRPISSVIVTVQFR